MIRAYRATGYTGAVCTSHYHPDRYLVTREQVEEGVILLQEACEKERIDFSCMRGTRSMPQLTRRRICGKKSAFFGKQPLCAFGASV